MVYKIPGFFRIYLSFIKIKVTCTSTKNILLICENRNYKRLKLLLYEYTCHTKRTYFINLNKKLQLYYN